MARARRPAVSRRRSDLRARLSPRFDVPGRQSSAIRRRLATAIAADRSRAFARSHPRAAPRLRRGRRTFAPRTSPLLFIDLETTGIAGGAGTYAFLVGCGWFDGGVFRTRQYFLSSFTAERALLEDVAELAAHTGAVVTYNGKTFDLPLIETRYSLHRLQTPFAGLPHLDMLHPARRMWREPESACRLITLEQTLCGYVREGDVAGVRDSGALLPLRARRRCTSAGGGVRAQSTRPGVAGPRHGARRAVTG